LVRSDESSFSLSLFISPALSHSLTHKHTLLISLHRLQVMNPSQTVVQIRVFSGSAVDSVHFDYQDGSTKYWGNNAGGNSYYSPFVLNTDEYITRVQWRDSNYFGNRIMFTTSEGRTYDILSNSGVFTQDFSAPEGHYVTELVTTGSTDLAGIIVAAFLTVSAPPVRAYSLLSLLCEWYGLLWLLMIDRANNF
jgi:hypothetical protein